MQTYLRNSFIAVFVIMAHLGAIWGIAYTGLTIEPPQVITVSLLGSLVAPPAQAQTASAQSAPAPAAAQPVPPAVESAPPPAPPPKPPVETPRPRPRPPQPRPQPERPRPPVPAAPVPPVQAPVEAPVSQSAEAANLDNASGAPNAQAQAANTSGSNAPATRGDPSGVADAVTGPSSSASYLNNAKPPYPPLSRRMREEGRVILRVLVTAQGVAGRVEIRRSSGFSRLDQAALNAVRNWRFVPAKRGNTPIEMWYDVPIDFSLRN